MRPTTYMKVLLNALTLPIISACAGRFALEEGAGGCPVTVALSYESVVETAAEVPVVGDVRCVVRAYPVAGGKRSEVFVREVQAVQSLSRGYDSEVVMELPAGEYELVAWSDLSDGAGGFYDSGDFAEVALCGEHAGSTDYRDAFCGCVPLVVADGQQSGEVRMDMYRPLARYEVISDDFAAFASSEIAKCGGGFALADYTVVFSYVGYMPDKFNIYSDRPVDSATGVVFRSAVKQISDTQASLGFDYVFVGTGKSYVTVKIGVYDADGGLVSATSPIKLELYRDRNTIRTGSYLTSRSSDGINIDQELDGSFEVPMN